MKNIKYWFKQLFNMLLLFLGGKRKEETEAQKIYRLLSPIPKEDWIMGSYTDYQSKCCFLGHYSRMTSTNPNDFSGQNCSRWEANIKLTELRNIFNSSLHLIGINDTPFVNGYNEDNPKDRVIHLLKDMIKAGY